MKNRSIFIISLCVVALLFLRISLHKNDMCISKKHPSGLVALGNINPAIKTDLMYASDRTPCYVLDHVGQALSNVQDELEEKGLGLLVWDAYRPISAQNHIEKHCSDECLSVDAKHTRGTTVDVTLIDLKTGEQLEMSSGFDECSEQTNSSYQNLPTHIVDNRELLQNIMKKHGFDTIGKEWWHFDYNGWQNYPPLEIEFNELC